MTMEPQKSGKFHSGMLGTDKREYIDFANLLEFYIGRLPLFIIALLAGAFVSGFITIVFIPNRYTATSRLYMVSASTDSVINLADLNIGTSLSSDYVELMQTRTIVEGVIETLELSYTYEELLKMIKLDVVPNTRIVRISVTSRDPREAMEIANSMAKASKKQLPKVMEAPAPSIAEKAVLPTRRSSPSLTQNAAFGALGALLLVLFVLTAMYWTDDTIKTSDELEKIYGVIPLSVIPEGIIQKEEPKQEISLPKS